MRREQKGQGVEKNGRTEREANIFLGPRVRLLGQVPREIDGRTKSNAFLIAVKAGSLVVAALSESKEVALSTAVTTENCVVWGERYSLLLISVESFHL